MNEEWSKLNKSIQMQLKKESTYKDGIRTLLELRNQLMHTMLSFKEVCSREDFNALPYMNANGYHSKSIVYSLWHVFRIEDIVAHSLIQEDEQIFFSKHYDERIHAPIITTGNELTKDQLEEFSKQISVDALYEYMMDVKESTECILQNLSYKDLKIRIPEEKKEYLNTLKVVDKKASWLVDYWCEKDRRGLMQMPFSRHWIMHVEACIRIQHKLHPNSEGKQF